MLLMERWSVHVAELIGSSHAINMVMVLYRVTSIQSTLIEIQLLGEANVDRL